MPSSLAWFVLGTGLVLLLIPHSTTLLLPLLEWTGWLSCCCAFLSILLRQRPWLPYNPIPWSPSFVPKDSALMSSEVELWSKLSLVQQRLMKRSVASTHPLSSTSKLKHDPDERHKKSISEDSLISLPYTVNDPTLERSPLAEELIQMAVGLLIKVKANLSLPSLIPTVHQEVSSTNSSSTTEWRVIATRYGRIFDSLAGWISDRRNAHLPLRLYMVVCKTFLEHVRRYKATRRDILNDGVILAAASLQSPNGGPKNSKVNPQHLDDFNFSAWGEGGLDSSARSNITTSGSSANASPTLEASEALAKLNTQIVERLASLGRLHPTILQRIMSCSSQSSSESPDMNVSAQESKTDAVRDHFKHLYNHFWHLLEDSGHAPAYFSELLFTFVRDYLTSEVQLRLYSTVCNPLFINSLIIRKAEERLEFEAQVKGFKQRLDSHFIGFPSPIVKLASGAKENLPSNKTVDLSLRLLKKLTSEVDLRVFGCSLNSELRRKMEDLQKGTTDAVDVDKRYINSLHFLQQKFDKKLESLTSDSVLSPGPLSPSSDKIKSDSPSPITVVGRMHNSNIELLDLLSEYSKSTEGSVTNEASSRLYFFMKFIEGRLDRAEIMTQLQFWLICEKYKRIVDRFITTTMSTTSTQKWTALSDLIREAEVIYMASLASPLPALDCLSDDAIQRVKDFILYGAEECDPEFDCYAKCRESIIKTLNSSVFSAFIHSEQYLSMCSMEKRQQLLETATPATPMGQKSLVIPMANPGAVLSKSILGKSLKKDNTTMGARNDELANLTDAQILASQAEKSMVVQMLVSQLHIAASALGKKDTDTENLPASKGHRKLDSDSDPMGYFSALLKSTFTLPFYLGSGSLAAVVEPSTDPTAELDPSIKDAEEIEFEKHHRLPTSAKSSILKQQHISDDIDTALLQLQVLHLIEEQELADSSTSEEKKRLPLAILKETQEFIISRIGHLSREKLKLEIADRKEAIVPGQCHVRIMNTVEEVGELGTKAVVYYVLHLYKTGLGLKSGEPSSSWDVKRRYSDFYSLHCRLKRKFPMVQDFELPGKNVGFKKSETIKSNRIHALERYIQRLIDNQKLCESDELKSFLSSSFNESPLKQLTSSPFSAPTTRLGKFMASKIGVTVEGRPLLKTSQKIAQFIDRTSKSSKSKIMSMLRVRNRGTAFGRVGSSPVSEANKLEHSNKDDIEPGEDDGGDAADADEVAMGAEDEALLKQWIEKDWTQPTEADIDPMMLHAQVGTLLMPLCSIVIELYDLKESTFSMKMKASEMLLKDTFGVSEGCDSFISHLIMSLFSDENLPLLLRGYGLPPRSFSTDGMDSNAVQAKARKLMTAVWPESFDRALGTEGSNQGTSRLFDLFQNETLNQDFVLCLVDGVMSLLESEI